MLFRDDRNVKLGAHIGRGAMPRPLEMLKEWAPLRIFSASEPVGVAS
jgi:hypothetical protein